MSNPSINTHDCQMKQGQAQQPPWQQVWSPGCHSDAPTGQAGARKRPTRGQLAQGASLLRIPRLAPPATRTPRSTPPCVTGPQAQSALRRGRTRRNGPACMSDACCMPSRRTHRDEGAGAPCRRRQARIVCSGAPPSSIGYTSAPPSCAQAILLLHAATLVGCHRRSRSQDQPAPRPLYSG